MRWGLELMVGPAELLHHADLDLNRAAVHRMSVTRPAVVLGSTQPLSDLAAQPVAAIGLDVARRRSGGGLVLLVPGEHLWVDVVVPRSHPGWHEDVDRAAVWMGRSWSRALVASGCAMDLITVHRGRPIAREVGRHVCFGGVGSGEVLVGGRKLIGISQRRSRLGARFQCAMHIAFNPGDHVGLLSQPERHLDLLDRLATVHTVEEKIAETLVEHLIGSLDEDTATRRG